MPTVLSQLLNPACIELKLNQRRKDELIRELTELLARGGGIEDVESLSAEILEREELTSTGIGSGIAIPHCLTDQVAETRLAFGRKDEGARFDAVDNQPVQLFFLLVGPKGDHARHLRVLSKIARYLHDKSFCRRLREAATPEEVMQALRDKEGA